jgi:hypothetical protein
MKNLIISFLNGIYAFLNMPKVAIENYDYTPAMSFLSDQNFESFEGMGKESLEYAEALVQSGMSARSAAELAKQKFNPLTFARPVRGGTQLNFVISRIGKNLHVDLPAPLFSANDLNQLYVNLIQQAFYRSGITGISVSKIEGGTLTASSGSKYNYYEIFYTDGVATDSVRITLKEYAYPSFLQSMIGGTDFMCSEWRLRVPDATYKSIFNNSLYLTVSSVFGKSDIDTINPAAQQSEFAYKDDILTASLPIFADCQHGVVFMCKYDAAFAANYDMTLTATFTAKTRN